MAMINQFFKKPIGLPDNLMLKKPIWSTWAVFHTLISDQKILNYAMDIISNNYSYCQIEIDDRWQARYGDYDFDPNKFTHVKQFIKDLNDLGFRTTLWVHPFANFDSYNFLDINHLNYWIGVPGENMPSLTTW